MAHRTFGTPGAYRALADGLRTGLRERRYGDGERLPTEAELAGAHGVSRQTVRRAMQELVSEGLVYRVPGRGTFPTTGESRYLRQLGSVEELMGLALDTELEVAVPLAAGGPADDAVAERLELAAHEVVSLVYRRRHDGAPLCHTEVHLPPDVAAVLCDVPELRRAGARGPFTVLGLLDARLASPVAGVEQTITVAGAPAAAAETLLLAPGAAVLRTDRAYLDTRGRVVEVAVSWFHPERFSYRVRLRRQPG